MLLNGHEQNNLFFSPHIECDRCERTFYNWINRSLELCPSCEKIVKSESYDVKLKENCINGI